MRQRIKELSRNRMVLQRSAGFTIIEVLIVLAIAGLIMLVVFLAVPALNRSNRNNGYRNESRRIIGATNEFITTNANNLPTASTNTTSPPNDASKIFALANIKSITTLKVEPSASPTPTTPTLTTSVIRNNSKCNTTNTNATAVTSKQFAVLFAVEDSAGAALTQCIDS